MIKIISKKKYERLCYENDKLHEEVAFLRSEKEAEVDHVCDKDFCNDCVHAIKRYGILNVLESISCDLDRRCKDYVKRGSE